MGSRWYNLAVVLLWLASMIWLVTDKVLPVLLIGDPPDYQSIVKARRSEPPVGWRLAFDGRPIGWALSKTTPLRHELVEIRSRVHFDQLPLAELTPGWIGSFLRLTDYRQAKIEMDTTSKLLIDPLGRLSRFDAAVRLEGIPDVLRMEGNIEDGALKLTVRAGEFTYDTTAPISPDALLGDSLSPLTTLPDLRLGQAWTMPTFSPLGRMNSPLEILHAEVEGSESVSWGGETVDAWLVVYRSDPGLGLGMGKKPRGMLWVRKHDGIVLKQQVMVLSSRMTFTRLPEEEAGALAETAHIDEELTATVVARP